MLVELCVGPVREPHCWFSHARLTCKSVVRIHLIVTPEMSCILFNKIDQIVEIDSEFS